MYIATGLGVVLLLVSWLWPERGEALTPKQPAALVEVAIPPATAWLEPIDLTALPAPRPQARRQHARTPDQAPWKEISVRPGDSLARIFQRAGLRAADLQALLDSGPEASRLTRIHPGETLAYRTNADGRLTYARYQLDPLRSLNFERPGGAGSFSVVKDQREPEIRTAFVEGTIESSLFLAAARHGLSDNLIMSLAQVFQWDIDFVHDIRRGDRFAVLYEERWLGDERIGTGAILAAEFVNRGRAHEAVRYLDEGGDADYYSPEGRSMRRAFLRAPVEFSRISSNFNLRRMHPIHNRVAPHRGIDYAAPTGTPIVAAGDGVVTTAASHHANGNYIIIRHGEQYQTKYLHLHRFARGVRNGARVRQGQVIGQVGATGWATGPHLHYEFLVNGVHQNPRTVRLPQADPIAASELPRFQRSTQPLLAELRSARSEATQLAAARADSGSG